MSDRLKRVRDEIGKIIVGQQEVVDGVLICLMAGGHVLLEGVPGLGKTTLLRTLSRVLHLKYSRIQFTPDLMPADIIGSMMERLLPKVTVERITRFIHEGVMVSGSSGRTERFDTHGMRNGGVAFPAEVALGLLDTADGPRLTCITRDQSEKKMAEDQLRLFNRALDGIRFAVSALEVAHARQHLGLRARVLQVVQRGDEAVTDLTTADFEIGRASCRERV